MYQLFNFIDKFKNDLNINYFYILMFNKLSLLYIGHYWLSQRLREFADAGVCECR